VIQRNPRQAHWRDGLAACDMIAADIFAARELPENVRPVVTPPGIGSLPPFACDAEKSVTTATSSRAQPG